MARRLDDPGFLYIEGIGQEQNKTRELIHKNFVTKGNIRKIYIPPNNLFAKVYFIDKSAAKSFAEEPSPVSNWTLSFKQEHELQPIQNEVENSDSEEMEHDSLEENFNYVDVHGHPLTVLEDPISGNVFIPLKSIRRAGFNVFLKDNFDVTLINKEHILKEFNLHLLTEAKKFLLQNQVVRLDENDILKTIEKCGQILMDKTDNDIQQTPTSSKHTKLPQNNISSKENTRPPVNVIRSVANTPPNKPSPKPTEDKTNNASFSDHAPIKKFHSKNNHSPSGKLSDTGSISSKSEVFVITDYIDQISLDYGKTYELKIQHLENEKKAWVVLTSNQDIHDKILLDANNKALDMPVVAKPVLGAIYIADFEGSWCRVIMRDIPSKTAFFIDYGNFSFVKEVRKCPPTLERIPGQAVRLAKCNSDTTTLKLEDTIKLYIKNKYDDGTYLGTSQPAATPMARRVPRPQVEAPPRKASITADEVPRAEPVDYFNTIEPTSDLRNGQKVKVLHYDAEGVFLLDKKCNEDRVRLDELVKSLDVSRLNLQDVKKNQLVLCPKDGLTGLYRARVIDFEGTLCTVKYIDQCGDDKMSIKTLRNVTKALSEFPATVIYIKWNKFQDQNKNEALSKQLVESRDRSKITVHENNGLYDLVKENKAVEAKPEQKSLEQTPVEPKTIPKVETVPKGDPPKKIITIDDMEFTKVDLGTQDLLCHSCESLSQITLMSLEDSVFQHYESLSELQVTDKEPYAPQLDEMVLAQYIEDGVSSWNRAVVLEKTEGKYHIMYADYGNMAMVSPDEMRRFPPELVKIPIVGVICELANVPHTKAVLDYIKPNVLQQVVNAKVLSVDKDFKYSVELPDLYEKMKLERLF